MYYITHPTKLAVRYVTVRRVKTGALYRKKICLYAHSAFQLCALLAPRLAVHTDSIDGGDVRPHLAYCTPVRVVREAHGAPGNVAVKGIRRYANSISIRCHAVVDADQTMCGIIGLTEQTCASICASRRVITRARNGLYLGN